MWCDGWRHELADICVGEHQRRPAVSSSPTPSVPVPVEKTSAVDKAVSTLVWSGTHARLGTKIKVVDKKQGVNPTLVVIVVPKTGRSGERQVCQAFSNVTVMTEIARGFAEDVYQDDGERDKKIQQPRMKRPVCIGESGAAKRNAMKGGARGTAGHALPRNSVATLISQS